MQWIYLILIFALSYLLGVTADFSAQTLRKIKTITRLNEFLTAFFILGAVTSAPEVVVAILSAIEGTPQLSLGNLMGSTIVVLSLMLGLATVFAGNISIKGLIKKEDFIVTLVLVGLPVLFVLDGYLSRQDGIILILSFIVYLRYFYVRKNLYKHKPGPDVQDVEPLSKNIFLFLLAAISLLAVSYVLIDVSLRASVAWGVPVFLVGLLMISIGTNIPEMAFVVKQLSKSADKYKDIATGILLGNVVFNTPTLGLLAVIRPFRVVSIETIWITSILIVITLIILGIFVYKDLKLSRVEGALLLIPYVCFVVYLVTSLNFLSS